MVYITNYYDERKRPREDYYRDRHARYDRADTGKYPCSRALVTAIKWCSLAVLTMGLVTFILSLVLFGVEFSIKLTATNNVYIIPHFILAFFALGAGVIGSTVGSYEGQIHNISAKNVTMALNSSLLLVSIFYMILEGAMFFQDLHIEKARTIGIWTSKNYAVFGLFVTMFSLALLFMVFSVIIIVLSVQWKPVEDENKSPYSSEKFMIETHSDRHAYRKSPHSYRY